MAMLEQALSLAASGFRVLPLFHIAQDLSCGCGHRGCENAGKHPRLGAWQRRATTDKEKITEWWTIDPRCGIGIATGSASGVWVLDIDTRHDGDESLADWESENGDLPMTMLVHTGGGGYHHYFKWSDAVEIRNRANVLDGVDVRGEGGFVVAPGSAHVSGRRYVLDVESTSAPVDAPPALIELVTTTRSEAVKASETIEHGSRNDRLMRLAASMRAKGFSVEGIEAALQAENEAHCVPPIDVNEVSQIAQSVSKYQKGTPGNAGARLIALDALRQWVKVQPMLASSSEVAIGRQMVAEIADACAGVAPAFTDGQLWRYEESQGTWKALEQTQLVRIVAGYEGQPCFWKEDADTGEAITKPLSLSHNKIVGAVRVGCAERYESAFFDEAADGVAVQNGFLAVAGGLGVSTSCAVLQPFSAEHRARFSMDYTFNEVSAAGDWQKRAPLWSMYLESVFEGDQDAEDKRQLLQDFAGAALVPGLATKLQRCLALIGGGSNGKSVFMEVLSALMPREHVSHIPPQRFDDPYYVAQLRGRLLNVAGDIPDGNITGTDVFKSIIAGERVTARSPREKPFSFSPVAAHIYACNELPGSADMTHGYWRRFMVLKFNRRFARGQDAGDAAKAMDGLSESIIKHELSEVFAWQVQGAVRLMQRGDYVLPASSKNVFDEWRHESDSVSLWMMERCKPIVAAVSDAGFDGWSKSRTLYEDFRTWCQDSGFRSVAITKFGKRLGSLGIDRHRQSSGSVYRLKLNSLGESGFDWRSFKAASK